MFDGVVPICVKVPVDVVLLYTLNPAKSVKVVPSVLVVGAVHVRVAVEVAA